MFLHAQTVSGHVYLLRVDNERVDGHVCCSFFALVLRKANLPAARPATW